MNWEVIVLFFFSDIIMPKTNCNKHNNVEIISEMPENYLFITRDMIICWNLMVLMRVKGQTHYLYNNPLTANHYARLDSFLIDFISRSNHCYCERNERLNIRMVGLK